ncbi:glutamate--tRNA ligase [Candidatus Peregrinibacteria bacterium CG10_big_fil_rev_8_21_14_0_10_36_19]|nr:MAG: glutamate--tRNA ligase [Candidatus Peregrinibacteria bacterium CG10_big_fil_rev_8_21_14_0_10_36_19]
MIRTRFAPSPTGYLHVGGLRTALYCYLFAKKNKGQFILRIEDTDQARFVEGAMENLINTLHWVGLEYDEGPNPDGTQKGNHGPYIQSQRNEIYTKYAQELIEKGHAYRCFCTKERLDEMRELQTQRKEAPMYDRKCLNLSQNEIRELIENGTPFVVRQKMPYKLIKFKDQIRGNVQFDGKIVDDQVLVKSDGFPTYHLANVVDDHTMEITHVIRGEEWLPSTPKHIALYEAFGWETPEFAHLPLLLNPDKTKLSKRQGDVAVEDYINKGYSKEAIINFVALLGWHPGGGENQEIYSLQELENIFSIEKVHKTGAVFNIEKLDWFNWQWRKKTYEEETENDPEKKLKALTEYTKNHLNESFTQDKEVLNKALLIVEEKILKDPKEINENIHFFFDLPNYDQELLTHEKMGVDLKQAQASLEACRAALENQEHWSEESIKEALLKKVEELGVKNGQLLWPLRAALTGVQFSPGAFEAAYVLGKKESLNRINSALAKL